MTRTAINPTARLAIILFCGLLAVEVTLLFMPDRVPAFLLPLAILFNWPGLILLGVDETTERYGYWGARILHGVCSVPVLIFYAMLLASFRRDHVPGHCPACGYDLRASKHACPECGKSLA